MISKTELRIGNLIESNGSMMEVKSITETTVELYLSGYEADNWEEDLEDCNPIPLTAEILSKCGFSKNGSIQLTRRLFLDWSFGSEFWLSDSEDGDVTLHTFENINSLHQLQNLYFAIAGKELESSSKTKKT